MSGIGGDCARLRYDRMSQIDSVEEILIDILTRLPIKTVAICKSVSKYWSSLISDPQFPVMQLCRLQKKLKYVICPYPEDSDVLTHLCLMELNGHIGQDILLPDLDEICSPEVVCFTNGLICSVDEDEIDLTEVNVRILNPVTRDILLIPRGTPSAVLPSVGVAFDPKTNDFKVFRWFSDESDELNAQYKCEVYTRSESWRLISEDVACPRHNPFNPFFPYYTSIAGSVHWFAWSKTEVGHPVGILSVDMNDKFTNIKLPTKLYQWAFLVELEGCLSVVHIYYNDMTRPGKRDGAEQYLEVFKLENHEWHLRAKTEMELMNLHGINSVIAHDNEIFFIIGLVDDTFCYLIFDLNTKNMRMLNLHDTFEDHSPVAFRFVASLLKCSGP